MFKPKVLGTNFTLGANFAEQEVPVSISVDEFDFTDTTPYKVFVQLEPPDIVPTEQRLIDSHTFYDLIITWNQRVLEGCPNNTEKYIFGTCRWATEPKDHCDVSKKQFAVSYLTSSKVMCKGHHFRHEIFNNLPAQIGDLPVTKYMSPPEIPCKRPLLYPFQYSIIMENGRRTNWITEKLIDCLVSRTIPLYWGAPNIGEYFDSNAILTFETFSDLSVILRSLTPDFYQKRLASIDHNLQEAMKYTDVHARINDIIRRRLSEHYAWTPSTQQNRQDLHKRLHR